MICPPTLGLPCCRPKCRFPSQTGAYSLALGRESMFLSIVMCRIRDGLWRIFHSDLTVAGKRYYLGFMRSLLSKVIYVSNFDWPVQAFKTAAFITRILCE